MSKSGFYLLLALIAFLSLTLRLINYDRLPPFKETMDEFMYPWAGITFLTKGTPSSWSMFPSYGEEHTVGLFSSWGIGYYIVSPWMEKPPLYPLITGIVALMFGQDNLQEVRLSTIRLVPITLSVITIILIGLVTQRLFNSIAALIAASLYATIPTIVMANRLSITENLLTPITLLALLIFSLRTKGKWQTAKPYLLGLCSGLALLTKDIGVFLPIALIGILLLKKKWRYVVIISIISLVSGLIHPLIGLYYDWDLFLAVLEDYRKAHSLGLPQIIYSIIQYPVIGHKEKIFLDGSILAGYLLLFTSPFWLLKNTKNDDNFKLFLAIPFSLLSVSAILEGGDVTFYGWHYFPFFPFLVIVLAKLLHDLWQNPDLLKSLFFYLIIGSSTIRFFLLLTPQLAKTWQWILAVPLLILTGSFFLKPAYQKIILMTIFIIFLAVNIIIILNLDQIYPSSPQPFD
ncbi:hypothetical protein A2362_02165 [Candidatus Curtissbacteria bacterium RIFOXYB1_FULL_41_59]|uniref:Glycosyltransferase RgtA/B/C/D-like domain-containing protein n=1 Tax=Candidatus Curtissbacteria bacterium RIFOXYA1_FULL_41_14 TaxID=1797737 RepID=A0A1F5HC02_9BACT|nr:MAG: hypothetical protein A2683_02375 [Candidatus Curtissbacteria bacterium RIFCSPHIGHO2_01_FULL_34_40]OGD91483.1 MAG: hypothetical protein A3E14_00425 [Candidatus Curtissbacteria bacterium RIFCSPHIGHO2_12_FULL_41_13]OGE01714.1 MAG: hypothetical protein A2196_02400 [Candidatus Curtissbacteria bacterium RIFOXYA1_FULL_41_14]OGE04349.1 MAG: hypothetical protein A2362_02165 [Candidatus Curtissbacteria bacterium RIFOXYB1_FULL_41_59]OGE08485.1 MAG: hypothetical protein A2615_01305 [Candidatus Curt